MRRARHWIANRGVRGLLKEFAYRASLLLRGKPLYGTERKDKGPHPFDVAYGVETTGLVWGEELGESLGSKESQYWTTGYYGIAPSAFTAALERAALDFSRFTFVDVGCGKGRAMLAALRFPFRQIVGVELSTQLVQTAERNLAVFRAPWRQPDTPSQAIAADATEFTVPSGPLLLFLYHPFAAPVMKRFLTHLEEAARDETRDIMLLYANPELTAQILETSGFVQLWRQAFPLSAEDSAADRFGSTEEYFAMFVFR